MRASEVYNEPETEIWCRRRRHRRRVISAKSASTASFAQAQRISGECKALFIRRKARHKNLRICMMIPRDSLTSSFFT